MHQKQTILLLAAAGLWAMLATGCGSGAGRQAVPGDPPGSNQTTNLPTATADGENDGKKLSPALVKEAAIPTTQQTAEEDHRAPHLPERSILAERFRINGERNSRWNAVGSLLANTGGNGDQDEWTRCSALLQDIIAGYEKLSATARPESASPARNAAPPDNADPFAPFLGELAFQDNHCEPTVFDAGVRRVMERMPPEIWRTHFTNAGGWPLSPRTRLISAQKLAESGNLLEAVALLQNLPDESLTAEEIGEQSRLLADCLLASGRAEEATAAYRKLLAGAETGRKLQEWGQAHADLLLHAGEDAEAFQLYQSVMQGALASSSSAREEALVRLETSFPKSPVTALAVAVHRGNRQGSGTQAGDEVATIAPAATTLAPLPTLTEEQTRHWEEALKLLELKRHDEAIALLSLLHNSPYAEQAKVKIRTASTLAATELRQQAAAAFSRARKATVRTEQQAMLLQSKQLLETVLARYPEAEIRDKVIQNLREVDRQLAGPSASPPGSPTETSPR